jgi:hypothetical protein
MTMCHPAAVDFHYAAMPQSRAHATTDMKGRQESIRVESKTVNLGLKEFNRILCCRWY